MSYITKVIAREVLDSRGNPTIEVDVTTKSGAFGRAVIPSGASTGKREAIELRDGDPKRFGGKGVLKAVNNVNKIATKLIGKSVLNQKEIDKLLIELDGTHNKSKLGANAVLGVSLAVARAGADYVGVSLFKYLGRTSATLMPMPMFNVINGGAHADSSVDFQEYMIVPIGAKKFKKAIQIAAEVFNALKRILKSKKLSIGVGDEGGFAPDIKSNEKPLQLMSKAVIDSGYILGKDIAFALDVAGNEFYDEKTKQYVLKKSQEGVKTTDQMIAYYQKLAKKYPIISIEDPFAESDVDGFTKLTKLIGDKVQIVGDDLFVTNASLLKDGINKKMANTILIKPNQVGTLTETLETIALAQNAKYKTIISHRSGETEDTFIADLCVATNAGQIKSGSVCRGERISKYNQLLRIEEELGDKAKMFSYKK